MAVDEISTFDRFSRDSAAKSLTLPSNPRTEASHQADRERHRARAGNRQRAGMRRDDIRSRSIPLMRQGLLRRGGTAVRR